MKVDVDINACKQGERKALGNLYKAYSDRLLRITTVHEIPLTFQKVTN